MPSLLHWGSRQKAQTPTQNDMCEVNLPIICIQQCGQKPKFIEPGGSRHPYCSRSCAKHAQGASPSACALRGCRATGQASLCQLLLRQPMGGELTGRALGQWKDAIPCHDHPRASASDLCIACDRKMLGPRLKELSVGSASFHGWSVNSSGTRRTLRRPRIDKVYQVSVPRNIRDRHTRTGNTAPILEIRVFHSAQCICDMGTKTPALCSFKSCGICCIVKSSFNEFAFGEKFNTGRVRLADVHATSATSTPYRVMIACDVAIESDFEVPDEESLFVPCADAIVPAFIIMYTV
ncbi:hypothetical protein B0H14DRAFT_3101370 [Mycena olivaceomarginata]|nr:hypothetical protein B0H14DRAFT_3101370 [Mycena olivaceomarginata]